MSDDNFWYVKGGKVFMGFASDLMDDSARAEERFKKRLAKGLPQFEGTHEEAVAWARSEYAEYGIYWNEDE